MLLSELLKGNNLPGLLKSNLPGMLEGNQGVFNHPFTHSCFHPLSIFFKDLLIFIFGCPGSELLHCFSLIAVIGGYSLRCVGSVVVALGLSCQGLDQGSSLRSLHWQVDS